MSFRTWRSYSEFSASVRSKQRYILTEESSHFLETILETCNDRIRVIKKDSYIWRAQVGHDWRPHHEYDDETETSIYVDDLPCPYPHERMKPLIDSATEGRVNSKGIPYLYVASDKETAMAEARPWLGALVTACYLKVKKDIKILDFSVGHGKNNFSIYFKESPTKEEIVDAVWLEIDNAFSKPIKVTDTKSDYAPTQIIAEFIKSKGYDGIAYKSSLHDGYNIALFDMDVADIINCKLFKTSNIKFEFEEEPY
ncbi:MAG: RES family NAD+ phosphorylase [Methylococcales bacterium]